MPDKAGSKRLLARRCGRTRGWGEGRAAIPLVCTAPGDRLPSGGGRGPMRGTTRERRRHGRERMIEPRVGIRQFATSVVRAAMARGDDAQGVTARLYESLANLVGPAGFDVLLARSLVLARRANPFLDNVVAGP